MAKKSFFTVLLVFMAVLGAKAQNNKDHSLANFEGNGIVITRDYDVGEFKAISLVASATVNYTVSSNCSCRVTLDENLFEYLDIYLKEDCLRFEHIKTFEQANMKPTKFVIEICAPTLEKISLVGGGDFIIATPFEAPKLEINMSGAYGVFINETVTVQDFKMNLVGAGQMVCKNLYADHANLAVAGLGSIVIEAGKVRSADITVAGTGSVETRCNLVSMDFNIAGSGTIRYHGDVNVSGTNMGGRIVRIDTENIENERKGCHEKL
jgi:hypothetical protein